MTTTDTPPQLVRVQVDKLLGRFDHTITFPVDWPFVIIHGPNGVGKTKLLELIRAVFRPNLQRVSTMPFAAARFDFSDGSILAVMRASAELDTLFPTGEANPDQLPSRVHLELRRNAISDGVEFGYSPPKPTDLPPSALRMIEREHLVERIGPDLWVDHRYADQVTTAQIVERYGEPPVTGAAGLAISGMPDELAAFIATVNVHLVETQRLLAAPRLADRGRYRERDYREATVMQFADDLKAKLRDVLAENSRQSQQLDKTFPSRILSSDPTATMFSEHEIRERYSQQDELRKELAAISLIDASADVSLPERGLEDWEKRVLTTYLQDTEQKLQTFRSLLDRIRLLQRLINSRFKFKQLSVDRDEGFRFETDLGQRLRASQLSSGEQHEVVLDYDLLFNAHPGSLVLIDEPEISLHVAWQQAFLADMLHIYELTGIRFIVATHSPQIVNNWWLRAVGLGGSDSGAHLAEGDDA